MVYWSHLNGWWLIYNEIKKKFGDKCTTNAKFSCKKVLHFLIKKNWVKRACH